MVGIVYLRPNTAALLQFPTCDVVVMPRDAASGATGERFKGEKTRDIPKRYQKLNLVSSGGKQNTNKIHDQLLHHHPTGCEKWVVVTTIYEPSEAVQRVAKHLTEWCMVVVADTKTPTDYLLQQGGMDATDATSGERVIFLSVQDQEKLASTIPFVRRMPYRSFARKNIGYLYAIWNGASVIFDLDDDNIVRLPSDDGETGKTKSGLELLNELATDLETEIAIQVPRLAPEYEHKAFNPFPLMGATISGTWPRGLPLTLTQNPEAQGTQGDNIIQQSSERFGIIQSVCNHDPDVDAVYRLTRPLPFDFRSNTPLQIPASVYTPYNAQATLHFPSVYWGMYLPMTVTGRVSDIWRSYIVQRLMRELESQVYVIYSPPLVTQIRNAHDYLGDMAAEQHLYFRTEALLEFLDAWEYGDSDSAGKTSSSSSSSSLLPERIYELWIALYERGYVELDDILAMREWLQALQQGGYNFPTVRQR